MEKLYTTPQTSAKQLIAPNAVREGDLIEARFPNGEIEHGIAVREEKPSYHCWYRNKRRMMLCTDGAKRGHIITGCAGFPDGTRFYRVKSIPDAKNAAVDTGGQGYPHRTVIVVNGGGKEY